MPLSENALAVLRKRYFKKRPNDDYETWNELCIRVANHVSQDEKGKTDIDKWASLYYDALYNLDFLPNSPALKHYGVTNGCGAACFVLPIEDSRRSIFETLADAVDVQANGGGTGFSFSRLRPEGFTVHSTGGKASGPISFMSCYDFTIGETIKQGGVRHGANMGVLNIEHPDIEKFIKCKSQEGKLSHFNISIGMTDTFISALKNDDYWTFRWAGKDVKRVKAADIWKMITKHAWATGDPGILFIDTVNRKNPITHVLGPIEATNPCGEQPLHPYGVCNLGSINLYNHVKGDWTVRPAEIDWDKLGNTVQVAVRFMDSAISVEKYPLPKIYEHASFTRQIGLGVMGFADMLIKMHIPYGSDRSFEVAEKVMEFVSSQAHIFSTMLGNEKGVAPIMEHIDWPKGYCTARRNALLTTCAPTGSLSLIANCSSGLEPVFAFTYDKLCLESSLNVAHPLYREYIEKVNGGISHDVPEYFVSAMDISYDKHVRMQAAFQKFIDAGVSKTINLPNSATEEDVSKAYLLAYELGCKGITIYRYGCKETQALSTGDGGELVVKDELKRGYIKPRPDMTVGPTFKLKSACGKLYVQPSYDEDGLIEVFISNTGGGCEANSKAVAVLTSFCIRAGVAPQFLVQELRKIQCRACMRQMVKGDQSVEIVSCPAGVARAIEFATVNFDDYRGLADILKMEFTDTDPTEEHHESGFVGLGSCPDCNTPLRSDAGCLMCIDPYCGWSRCE